MDLISRQAALDALIALTVYSNKRDLVKEADNHPNTWIEGVAECIDEIEDLPSAQPERKTGRWLIREGISDAQCSECGMYFNDVYDMENSDAFCRHCGAKMEGLKVVEDE